MRNELLRRTYRTQVTSTFLATALALVLLGSHGWTVGAVAATDGDYADITAKSIQQWRDMKFGLFVHWGPVSIKGTEIGWSRGREVPIEEYDALYKQFNPTEFDAEAWVQVAKAAGMKYLVLTSKHHDGFCLWPSKYTDYHIGNTPFGRDVMKELAAACKKYGVQFCTYHSICDWHHPDYPLGSPGGSTEKPNPNMPRYYEYLKSQTTEIIENYGPLGIMWFDGEWEKPWTIEYGNALYAYLKGLQPSLIINNRVSKGRAGMAGTTKDAELNAGDYDTPEQRVGGFNRQRPWETCMTICRQWAWKPNDQMKSKQECIQTLLQTVGGDGNLLFNVGPMPDGRIEPHQVERLKEMGAWLDTFGAGVYGTRGGPFKPGRWGASTCKENVIYVFIMNWPEEGPLTLPPIDAQIVNAQSLNSADLDIEQSDTGIAISVPDPQRDPIATVIKLTVDRKAFDIEPVTVPNVSGSLTAGRSAKASNVFQNSSHHNAAMAVDDNSGTRWATDSGTDAAWLEVDLGKPQTIGRVAISEAYDRVRRFELQRQTDQGWTTFFKGARIGERYAAEFAPVTARHVRLNILEATEGPTLWEFHLMAPK